MGERTAIRIDKAIEIVKGGGIVKENELSKDDVDLER